MTYSLARFTSSSIFHVCVSSLHSWRVFIPRVPWTYNYLKLKAWSVHKMGCGQENRVVDPITRPLLVPKLKMHEHVPALPPIAACCVKWQVVRRIQTENQVIGVTITSEETINCRTKRTLRTEVKIREFQKGPLWNKNKLVNFRDTEIKRLNINTDC